MPPSPQGLGSRIENWTGKKNSGGKGGGKGDVQKRGRSEEYNLI
jgi:hypothetical protein